MSAIFLEGQVVHYEVLGRGRPVLFLHGWVGSWRYWIPAMQAASVNCRAYALDLWGFGDTGKAAERYSLEMQTALVEGFLDHLGIARIALAGHGLGAAVAIQCALRRPEMISRVMGIALPLDESRIHARLRADSPAVLADWLIGRSDLTEPVRTDAPKADPRAITTSLSAVTSLELGRLQTPCLLVHGANDPVITAPDLDLVAAMPEQVHAVILENCAHFPMIDDSSRFHRLMADFLALAPGESPRSLQLKDEWKRRVR